MQGGLRAALGWTGREAYPTMSLLTNCQIRATIRGMETTVQRQAAAGNKAGTRRTLAKMLGYRAELMAREAAGENPGAEMQTVRHGESK